MMKTVDQVLSEPSPSTVNYRTMNNRRATLQNLIDDGPDILTLQSLKKSTESSSAGKLTWLNGVFIPVLLNIWGVIMFLRLGWVVGQAGLLLGTLIIVGANVVTGITALSLCAICTNGEVKGGGAYFLISRALGPVFGGTIGLLFFVAQAVAVSLYVVGFSEAVVDLMQDLNLDFFTGSEINDIRVVGFITAFGLFLMSLVGIGWYAKTQTGLLFILIVAIASVYIGAFLPAVPDEVENLRSGFVGLVDLTDDDGLRNLNPNFQTDPDLPNTKQGFFTVFAVFFPAVTGIMAGANLSGDLDNPSVAIPKGTLFAIAVTFVSYVLLLWLVGLTALDCTDLRNLTGLETELVLDDVACTFEAYTTNLSFVPENGLLYDRLIMKNISVWAPLVWVGVFAATLSSALASLVGAPRILQSVASDELFPFKAINFFAAGRGESNEPIRGYCLTFLITLGCVALGKLDVIAPIITNFFMISYAFTNYACYASSASKAPNWRPSFKYYNSYVSAFGALICLVVMFLISPIPAIVTLLVAVVIFVYLYNLKPDMNWGEAGEARKYTDALTKLDVLQLSEKVHVKTFRPQFLVMTGSIYDRLWLVKFTSLFQSGGGMMICGDVVARKTVEKPISVKSSADDSNSNESTNASSENNDQSIQSNQKVDQPHEPTPDAGMLENQSAQSVRNLFAKPDPKNSDTLSDDSRSSGEFVHYSSQLVTETAKFLGAELELVKKKRKDGEWLLNSSVVWGGKKCKGGFYEAVIASSLFTGFQKMLQLAGMGKMRPNTVVIGFKSDYMTKSLADIGDYEKILRAALSAHVGLVIVRDDNFRFDVNVKKSVAPFFPMFQKLKVSVDGTPSGLEKKETDEGLVKMFDQELKPQPESMSKTVNEKNETEIQEAIAKRKLEEKVKVQKYRIHDLEFMQKHENSRPHNIPGENVDVWWLADDGGLTMLLPQLLVENPMFKNKKLRVMAVTNKFQSPEETSLLAKTELRMVHLLNKFRIKANIVGVDVNMEQELNPATKQRFEQCMGLEMKDLEKTELTKTQRNLRMAEEIRKLSSSASVVFVILPIPDIKLRVKLHTTWLDMLSYDMPPMVMMRGNNENVLTFFC